MSLLSALVGVAGGGAQAQTVLQFTVPAGVVTVDTTLIATGDGFVPPLGGDAGLRDALLVSGGGTLTLLAGAEVTVKNDNGLTALLRVGYGSGESGTMTIASGASLTVGQAAQGGRLQVGDGAGATGTVTQTGGDVTVHGAFNVGVDGGAGTWSMAGGTLTLAGGLHTLGLNQLATGQSSGQLLLSGGTVEVQGGDFVLGDTGGVAGNGNGVVTQTGGVLRLAGDGNLYLSAYGNGEYNLNGGTLEIGGGHLLARYGDGTGTYVFTLGGGTIKVSGSALVTSVDATLKSGTISIIDTAGLGATWAGSLTGAGVLRKTGALGLTLTGAANAFGGLDVQEGAVTIAAGVTTVTQAGAGAFGVAGNGRLEVSGGILNITGSTNADLRTTYIGAGAGNQGTFVLSSGTVNVGLTTTPGVRADFEVGSFSGSGVATQTGGALLLNSTGGYLHLGNQGTGVYNLSGGTISTQNAVVLGRSTTAGLGSGTFNISGGTLTLASSTKGALIVGGVDASNTVTGGQGTINQTGGTVQIGYYVELGTKGGTGTYNLNGGTLEVGGAGGIRRDTSGTASFNLGGGTIKVTGTALTSGVAMTLLDRDPGSGITQSFIDTNGLGATLSGAITGAGTLVKMGTGTLTLSGANNITGEVYVIGGGIQQTAGASVIRYLGVASGSGTTGSYTLSGGSLTVSNTLQVGDWGGTGTFSQTGGNVSVTGSFNVGNQGGNGTYTLSGGTLTLSDGLYNLGRNTGANAASTGVFNLSGGLLEVTSGNFILGNRDATATVGNGTGVFNQTGGVFRVSGSSTGSLFLSAYGNGEYNLNGGTLEIGGDHLKASYSGSGTYAFNLGGGTLKVTGADLAATLDARLGAGTADNGVASRIDTNGFNATWAGALTGAQGGLIKTGTGNFTLSGNVTRTIGYLNADGGRIVQTAGATTVTELVVGSNHLMKDGAFTLSGGTITLAGSTAASPTPSFRIGDWGGTGQFAQTGGTIQADSSVVLGNRGGTGTYTLSGGTLNIGAGVTGSGSALILGRSRAADATGSSGTFNATGGTLHLFANAPLLIGGDTFPVADSGRSTGAFYQSGTSLVTIDSYLSLGVNGTGTYQLDGGTLQLGGANGIRRGSGTATFNFGGGLLQVIGSDLTTAMSLTLLAGRTSVVDTNGFNATFSGNLTSTGTRQIDYGGNAFAKIGAGQLTLSGASRTLNTFAVAAGSIRQTAGATTATEFMVGTGAGSTGSFVLDGGSIAIAASTTTGGAPVAGSFRVGDFSGTGTFTQNAGNVTVSTNGALNIGNQGGSGTYNLVGGTLTLAGGNSVLARSDAGKSASSGVLNISGGLLEILASSALIIGNNLTGAGVAAGSGAVVQTGGRVVVEAGSGLYVAGFGNGSYTLSGGSLELGGNSLHARYNNTTSTYAFNFGAGTIKVAGSDLAAALDLSLVAGGRSTIDTNGLAAIFSGSLTATDAGAHQVDHGGNLLAKVGAGQLTFSGASRVLDSFAVEAGSVRQTAGATTATEWMVGTGAGKTGAFTLDGGSLTINPSTTAGGVAVAGVLRVGDFGGTGTFTQNAGNVTVSANGALNIGNQGGTGTYNLAGGTLTLGGLLNTLARSDTGKAASSGTLNISGGVLQILTGSSLIIGNSLGGPGVAAGSGAMVQTGGRVTVAAGGGLYVAGFGNGSYTLSGGSLEIGGDSLYARYANGESAYSFNFGGGTLKVAGTDLTASLDLTLLAGTRGILDTNGLNATLSGALLATDTGAHQASQGGNQLTKTGLGQLTLSGASRVLDTFAIEGGLVRQTAGASTATEWMVGTGAGKTGAFTLDGGSLTIGASTATGGGAVAGVLRVGDAGGTGTFTQNAGNVTLGSNSALNIGDQGGSGTYTLAGGTLTLGGGLNTLAHSDAGKSASSGTLNISGGVLQILGNSALVIGNSLSGAGIAAGAGAVVQTGGRVTVATGGNLYVAGYGNGSYTLSGGALEIGGSSLSARYNNTTSAYAFNLGGGTLKVAGSDLTASLDLRLLAGAYGTLDTNGLNATLSGALLATDGGAHQSAQGGNQLTKTGLGQLTLSGASRVLDTFAIEGGLVRQTTGASTATEWLVGTGAGKTGAFTLDGGSLTISASTAAGGGAVAGTLRVGDFGGTGTFTQNGGTVTLGSNSVLNLGDQGGAGTYDLISGTLLLGGGVNTLGHSSTGWAASSGALNVSGGVLQILGNSSLVIGNSASGDGVSFGSGAMVQTGGRVVLDAGAHLYVAGYGNGSYTLSGGTLELGGSSLSARYGDSAATSAFTLGGGTIKVTGSDLAAALDAKLASATRSTINTNGFNATWSGALSGAGGFNKTGTGTLTLSHTANTFTGGVWVQAGTLALTGSMPYSTITVAGGGALTGTGRAGGLVFQSGSTFAPGPGLATFAVDGDVSFATGSTLLFGIGAGGNDLLAATGSIAFGGSLQISFTDAYSPVLGARFDLFDFSASSGSFSSLTLPTLGAGLQWDASQLYANGTLAIAATSAIPEPSTTAALVGAAMLGVALWRRQVARRGQGHRVDAPHSLS